MPLKYFTYIAPEQAYTAPMTTEQTAQPTPEALIPTVQAHQPINAHGLTSEPLEGKGYLIRHAGRPVLAWLPSHGSWCVDTWALERHEVLNFLTLALHHAGEPVLGVARIREEDEGTQAQQEAEPSEPNTSETAPSLEGVTGTSTQQI